MALTLGGLLKAVRDSGLPPERHAFFMPDATGACRFGSYAQAQKMALARMGMGDVRIMVPSSENAYAGLPRSARKRIWDGVLTGDYLFKLGLRCRPYEVEAGSVDRAIERAMSRFEKLFETMEDPRRLMDQAAREVLAVPRRDERRPLVGIVGEIYARCEPFANSFAIRAIEENGGEAWLAPFGEWLIYTVWASRTHGSSRGDSLWERVIGEWGNLFILKREQQFHDLMARHLPDRMEPEFDTVI